MFVHTVYYWLNPDSSQIDRAKMIGDAVELLAKVPSVRHLWSGQPAPHGRSVADSTYHIGLTIVFDDRAGYDLYREHPFHTDFGKRNRRHWHKVKVYDYVAGV